MLEAYALFCGLKIDKPKIKEEEVKNLPEKFILFNPHSKGMNRFYNRWQEVIDIIIPSLKEKNIEIIQIDSFEKEYDKCKKINNLTFNQTAFILKKSILLLGIDSFCMHVASCYNKPMVILFGGNVEFNSTKPYFGDYSNYKFFIPYLNGNKPTHTFDTGQEYINQFNPDSIAQSVIDLINR